MSEVDILKKEIVALQSQVAAIKTATNQEVREQAGTSDLQGLKEQIAELKVQVAASGVQRNQSERFFSHREELSKPSASEISRDRNGRSKHTEIRINRPRPWYCFRCGDDGHLAINCESPPNPSRVEEKRRKLRERQAEWDLQHGFATESLN